MRYLQVFLFLALLLATAVFAVQNTAIITVNFLTWNVSQPIALLTVVVYFLGMLSGWTVVAFARRSLRQVAKHPGQ
jgi:lipopolysaccharide assembly protein A